MLKHAKQYLKNRLTSDQWKRLKNIIVFICSFFCLNNLTMLAKLYVTDKCDEAHTHKGFSYTDIYMKYFKQFKKKPINLLEIGVYGGASLRLWKRYFPKASIFGLDIDPKVKQYEEKRIFIEIGSQEDEEALRRISDRAKEFDIIIDDGSHVNKHILKSFGYLFKKLKSGGVYIIEDLRNSYTTHGAFNNNRSDMDEFFKNIIYDMDHHRGDVLSMHFWSYLCIIIKA